MRSFIKVPPHGDYGDDQNKYVLKPGNYAIPLPDYRNDTYEYVNVQVTRVIDFNGKEGSRLNVLLGYDENGLPQAWYYNGTNSCFKRVFQDGSIGEFTPEYVEDFVRDSCAVNEEYETELIDYILAL